MSDYIGGANVTDTLGLFLVHDPAFLTYMLLLMTVLGFGALVRNMGAADAARAPTTWPNTQWTCCAAFGRDWHESADHSLLANGRFRGEADMHR
jgi:hypothetical protein